MYLLQIFWFFSFVNKSYLQIMCIFEILNILFLQKANWIYSHFYCCCLFLLYPMFPSPISPMILYLVSFHSYMKNTPLHFSSVGDEILQLACPQCHYLITIIEAFSQEFDSILLHNIKHVITLFSISLLGSQLKVYHCSFKVSLFTLTSFKIFVFIFIFSWFIIMCIMGLYL